MVTRDDEAVVNFIAHFLLMGNCAYPSPEEMARALIKRCAAEGFAIMPIRKLEQ